jgi:hypothetical protein
MASNMALGGQAIETLVGSTSLISENNLADVWGEVVSAVLFTPESDSQLIIPPSFRALYLSPSALSYRSIGIDCTLFHQQYFPI